MVLFNAMAPWTTDCYSFIYFSDNFVSFGSLVKKILPGKSAFLALAEARDSRLESKVMVGGSKRYPLLGLLSKLAIFGDYRLSYVLAF